MHINDPWHVKASTIRLLLPDSISAQSVTHAEYWVSSYTHNKHTNKKKISYTQGIKAMHHIFNTLTYSSSLRDNKTYDMSHDSHSAHTPQKWASQSEIRKSTSVDYAATSEKFQEDFNTENGDGILWKITRTHHSCVQRHSGIVLSWHKTLFQILPDLWSAFSSMSSQLQLSIPNWGRMKKFPFHFSKEGILWRNEQEIKCSQRHASYLFQG